MRLGSNLHCSIINGFTFHLFLIDCQLKYETFDPKTFQVDKIKRDLQLSHKQTPLLLTSNGRIKLRRNETRNRNDRANDNEIEGSKIAEVLGVNFNSLVRQYILLKCYKQNPVLFLFFLSPPFHYLLVDIITIL